MPSQTRSPGTVVSDSSIGTIAWGPAGNASSSDDSYAGATNVGTSDTEYLKATNYGFSIPAGATIDGMEPAVERQANSNSGGNHVRDAVVRIVKAGVISGDDKADTLTNWPTSDATKLYGGASDLCGLTLDSDDINATDFGFVLAATITGIGTEAGVDHMPMTVYYTEAPSATLVGHWGGVIACKSPVE